MSELSEKNDIAKTLYPIEIKSMVGTIVSGFLRMKSNAAATQFGKGINFLFPAFDRAQSIFIDTEEISQMLE
ncbi:MAG: hypothetical protein PHF63_02355 [Herbinix sp.]|nr:hypothetical protein [Herbinix sp.]